jgi:hypothetical protein
MSEWLPGEPRCGNCWFRIGGVCRSNPANPLRGKMAGEWDGKRCKFWITEGAEIGKEIERYLSFLGESFTIKQEG